MMAADYDMQDDQQLFNNDDIQVLNHQNYDDNRHKKKYLTLKLRCEQIQQDNEKYINRIHYVHKIIQRLKKQRKFLIKRLDQYGDNFRDFQALVPGEDEPYFNVTSDNVPRGILQPIKLSSVPFTSESLASPSETKRRKTEKEKDPNAPKKPANAFLMFCQQQRNSAVEEYNKNHPGQEVNHQELTKLMALRWKQLSTNEKKIYFDMYEKDKERYEQELQHYAETKIKME